MHPLVLGHSGAQFGRRVRMRQRLQHGRGQRRDIAHGRQRPMTPAGQDFLREALTAMGCADRVGEIKSVPDLIDFDEGRIE